MTRINLAKRFPASEPCSCRICLGYCRRPGWWAVNQAAKAIEAGYAGRMMLEISPEFTFGVLSPAFRGNEQNVAMQLFADQGCTFLKDDFCELFDTGMQPLECRFCHHTRPNLGKQCHDALEADWCSREGQLLVIRWCEETCLFERNGLLLQGPRINRY